jgi:hypothetical protein
MNKQQLAERQSRLEKANELIALIQSLDRQFLSKWKYGPHDERGGSDNEQEGPICFEFSRCGKLRFKDGYSRKWCYPYKSYYWASQRFNEGGTMWGLMCLLSAWIRMGNARRTCVIYGEYWGYTDEGMKKIRQKAEEIGYLNPNGEGDGWS